MYVVCYILQLTFGNHSVLQSIGPGKSFVDMSTVDVDTVTDLYEVSPPWWLSTLMIIPEFCAIICSFCHSFILWFVHSLICVFRHLLICNLLISLQVVSCLYCSLRRVRDANTPLHYVWRKRLCIPSSFIAQFIFDVDQQRIIIDAYFH